KQNTAIVWFRQDLRLADNPALAAAAESGAQILPVYVLDDDNAGEWAMGAASRWWLQQSLESLNDALDNTLYVTRGKADAVIPELVKQFTASAVFWNRCYEPWRIARDTPLKKSLQDDDIEVRTFNGSLLFEPTAVAKQDGTPYKVFTPFWRKGCLEGSAQPRKLVAEPKSLKLRKIPDRPAIDSLELLPDVQWYASIAKEWTPGEQGAAARLKEFLESGITNYKEGRNRPDQQYVSRLSPHLHFGELSPHQVWAAAQPLQTKSKLKKEVDHFFSELGWREFSYYLLFHWPEITRKNLQKKFNRFPWRKDQKALRRWQRGETGYPIVDAGMRELWETGYMHNRVRMIVGSFLVKNLMLHWHHGEDWFWDTLLDADLANNSASWQWIAGSGADAAPYFRVFNPVLQGNKFDPHGDYVRRFIPELAELPDKYLQSPWEAPEEALKSAGIRLGRDYPEPVVDLKASRERALEAFKALSPAD
ncbi:MAG: deoxyribodipyrimidine photo-lyase, partial [Woeseia sp.]